jgi:nitroreductase
MTNEFIQELKNRRSIRKYTKDPVEKELIEEIIQAGKYAPSATNHQPWRFIVITKKEMIVEIALVIKKEIKNILKKRFILKFRYPSLRNNRAVQLLAATAFSKEDILFFNAPVLIFIVTEKKRFYDESCACCAENMMLAAHSLGLGSCWIGFAHFIELNKEWMRKIGVPEGYHISACLVFGHPEGKNPKAPLRKPLADVIKWIS